MASENAKRGSLAKKRSSWHAVSGQIEQSSPGRPMLRSLPLAVVSLLVSTLTAFADDVAPVDPYWNLVHDQAILDDLKLTAEQRKGWQGILDPLDLRCFPLRNKPAAE